MPDLADGETTEMKGSGKKPYILKNTGGVYSCSCPAWRNQSHSIERRTCKHLKKLRGTDAEAARVGSPQEAPKKEEKEKPPLLLAHKWDNDQDLTGWWISEKLDGVRALWDGEKFLSRLGNEYHAPDWFKADMPAGVALDGELFLARGEFQKCVSIVRRQDKNDEWKKIKFRVFDVPNNDVEFELRMQSLKTMYQSSNNPTYWEPLDQTKCKGLEHVQQRLADIESVGGEGLMMREPKSKYEAGRSTTLLKIKSFFDDEAVVIGHTPGKGRHKGRTGALEVERADGVQFSVGTGLSDKQRESPPAIGTKITYRYQELTKAGVPRFPSFVGERID